MFSVDQPRVRSGSTRKVHCLCFRNTLASSNRWHLRLESQSLSKPELLAVKQSLSKPECLSLKKSLSEPELLAFHGEPDIHSHHYCNNSAW